MTPPKPRKTLQRFSAERLRRDRALTPEQTLEFIEDFKSAMFDLDTHRTPISIRIPDNVLRAFKTKAQLEGRPYQSVIVRLMREWLKS